MEVFSFTLVLVILFACIGTYAMGWLGRAIAVRSNVVDVPDLGRKNHSTPTALLGGAAVLFALLLSSLFFTDLITPRLAALLISGTLFCLLGLWDDLSPIRPRGKLIGQVLASLPYVLWGSSASGIALMGLNLQLGVFAAPLVLFWVVGLANAFNLIDGSDGLASVVGFVVAVSLAIVAFVEQKLGVGCISLALAGCFTGFLGHNWPPARMFLGDAGSLCVGYLLAAISVETFVTPTGSFAPVVPATLMGIPILDTLVAMVRRRLRSQSLGRPDREHIHHRLIERSLTNRQVLLTLGTLSLGLAALAFACRWLQNDLLSVICCTAVLAVLIRARVFGDREFSMLLQRLSKSSLMRILKSQRPLKATPSLRSNDDERSDADLIPTPFLTGQFEADSMHQFEQERRAA